MMGPPTPQQPSPVIRNPLTEICFANLALCIADARSHTQITAGVGVSAWGEAELVVGGLLLVLGSMCCEAARLTLVQKLLQVRARWAVFWSFVLFELAVECRCFLLGDHVQKLLQVRL